MRQRRPRYSLAVVLLAVVVPLLDCARATAQSAQLPDPVSSGIAERYAKRLELSDSQRRALLGVHAQYRDEYATLRDGAIADYYESNSSFNWWTATPEEAQATVKALENVMDAVRRVDGGLFDAMVPLLTDAQGEGLEQLRLARERECLLAVYPTARYIVPAASVDLGAIVDDLDLPEASRDAVAPVTRQYEREMAAAARRVFAAGSRQFVERTEQQARFRAEQEELMATLMPPPEALIDDAPADDEGTDEAPTQRNSKTPATTDRAMQEFQARSAEFQERMEELQRRQMEAHFDAQRELARSAVTMSAVNRRTARQLAALLPDDVARKLYAEYVRAAYNELPKLPGPADRLIEEALADESRDETERAALLEQQRAAAVSTGPIVEQMMDAVDERRSSGGRMWRAGRDDPAEKTFDEKMKQLRERWRIANNDVIAAAAETVPSYAERASALHQQAPDGGTDLSMVIVMVNEFPGMGTSLFVQGQRLRLPPDQLAAAFGDAPELGPIAKDALDRYARVLQATDDERVLLDALYDDYRTRYEATAAPSASMAAAANRGLWSVGDDSQVEVPAAAALDRARSLQHQAAEAIRVADEQFFDDVRVAVVDKPRHSRLERLRMARQRDRSPGGLDGESRGVIIVGGRPRAMGARGFKSSPEADLALDAMAAELDLGDSESTEIEPTLAAYVQVSATHARTRHDASLRIQTALEQTVVESWNGTPMQPSVIGEDSPYIRTRNAQGKAATAARDAMVALNRKTLKELRGALTAESAEHLRRAYRRAVYPHIYADESSAETLIGRTLELEDLTEEQRAAVAEIATEYRQSYEELSDELVEITQADSVHDPFDFSDQEGMRKRMEAVQERQRRSKQLRFDRSDMSERAQNRVRLLLTETQRERMDRALKEATDTDPTPRAG